jgi:hypothetical protein
MGLVFIPLVSLGSVDVEIHAAGLIISMTHHFQ